MKKDLLAIILAGGQGSRLGKLTRETAKPAVPFGGRYRIIDFVLSNCSNSGINNLGVITQYQPLELNEHISNGESWGMNGHNGSLTIIQPYTDAEGESWFKGTANAITNSLPYIDSVNPKYLLVLSGDHIYKMDYEPMFEYHEETGADLTVGVIPVTLEEASRFGIMNTDENGRVLEFEEKPEFPKNNLASMGIYIFNWDKLRKILVDDKETDKKMIDFGHDVIPVYLENKEKIYAYAFEGYWKDVGTIESLWEANMEFLDPNHSLHIRQEAWQIYTNNHVSPPQFLTDTSDVAHSMIVDGCYVEGEVKNSLLSQGVQIGEGSSVKNSVVMANSKIGKNVHMDYVIVGEKAIIEDGAKLVGKKGAIEVVGYGERIGGQENENE